ncbi:amidohydrolase [Corynebacterium variabile]|uniref:amidohydrolase n=1 Tax=Corynebacterium variabile TaxID=1727 RepID=UPI003FCF65A1
MATLYHSGTVITMDEDAPAAGREEAVVTDADRIVFVGDEATARARYGRAAEVDLAGRVLMPAFIDAHVHFMSYGKATRQVDLRDCTDIDGIVAALAERLAGRPAQDASPVVGLGYDHNNLPGYRHPTRHDLDRVSTSVPVIVLHRSSHMLVVNSAVLALVGITSETPDPEGGRFGREADGVTPDGYVEEISAMLMLAEGLAAADGDGEAGPSLLSPGSSGDQREAILTAQREYLARGITTVQEGAASPEEVDALIAAGHEGDLTLDVVAYPIVTTGGLDVLDAHPERVGTYEGRVRLGGCKLILDGSPQARSAWLSEPYEPEGDSAESEAAADHRHEEHEEPGQCQCGYPALPDDQVGSLIARAVDSGYQVLAHCNGDAASEQFLDAYAQVAESHPGAAALRPVMIHAQTVRDDQLDRMPALGMIASFFVGHVWFWGDTHLRNLGPERGRRISPGAFRPGQGSDGHLPSGRAGHRPGYAGLARGGGDPTQLYGHRGGAGTGGGPVRGTAGGDQRQRVPVRRGGGQGPDPHRAEGRSHRCGPGSPDLRGRRSGRADGAVDGEGRGGGIPAGVSQ